MKTLFLAFFFAFSFGCSSMVKNVSVNTEIAVCVIRHYTSPSQSLPEKFRLVYFLNTESIEVKVSDLQKQLNDLPFTYKSVAEVSKHPERKNVWDATLKKTD